VYTQYYQWLLLVIFVLAIGAFVLPVYFVHRDVAAIEGQDHQLLRRVAVRLL